MTSPARAKGFGYERELVDKLEALGLRARRAWGSNGASLGKDEEVDIVVNGDLDLQAKRRKSLAKYLKVPKSCRATVFREDRADDWVLMRLEDWADMVRRLDAYSKQEG